MERYGSVVRPRSKYSSANLVVDRVPLVERALVRVGGMGSGAGGGGGAGGVAVGGAVIAGG